MKQIFIKLGIGLTLILTFIFFYNWTSIGRYIEEKLYDVRFEFRDVRQPSKDIVIVAIDTASIEDLDTWPWPRTYHAEIVRLLKSYGAKVVAFDVIFNKLSREPENDRIFADEIDKAGNVVLGSMFVGGSYTTLSGSQENIEVQQAISLVAPDPYEEMLQGNLNYGVVNFQRDLDKSVRLGQLMYPLGKAPFNDLMPSTQTINNEFEPHFTLQILKHFDQNKYNSVIEKYKDNKFLINFAGPAHTYRTVSFSNIIQGRFLEVDAKDYNEFFKDKIVLIGATATVLHDTIPTPFTSGRSQDQMPGVEVHAATLDTIINGIEYTKASNIVNYGLIFAIGLASTALFSYLNPFFGIAVLFVSIIVYSLINISLFILNNLWLDWTGPIGVMLFVFSGIYSYRFFIEEREKRRVRNVFKRYMSPALVEEALKDPDKVPSLDVCSKKFITVLFSDIAGFTTMSEKFPPEEVKRILDEYLTAMTEIVFKYNGVLDKYIGDAIMAVYGNVGNEDRPLDALKAVRTAVEMQDKMKELRQKWVSEGSIAMQIRIGLHSGEALVGNFGSPLKMDYTVIGDTVNTAARLEGLNKDFGTSVMISQSTYELISDKINARSLGPAPVKGKSEALHVYEVISVPSDGEGTLVEDKAAKQTRWMRGNRETRWARDSKDTTWK